MCACVIEILREKQTHTKMQTHALQTCAYTPTYLHQLCCVYVFVRMNVYVWAFAWLCDPSENGNGGLPWLHTCDSLLQHVTAVGGLKGASREKIEHASKCQKVLPGLGDVGQQGDGGKVGGDNVDPNREYQEGWSNEQEEETEEEVSRRKSCGMKRKKPLLSEGNKTEDGGTGSGRCDGRACVDARAGVNRSYSCTNSGGSRVRQKKVVHFDHHPNGLGAKCSGRKADNHKSIQPSQLKNICSSNAGNGSKMAVEKARGHDREAGKRRSIQPKFLKSSQLQSSCYGERTSVADAAAEKIAAATPTSAPQSTSMLYDNAHKISFALVKAANHKLRV